MSGSTFYYWQGETLVLRLHVQPRASRDELCGLYGDSLKVRITAPPADGKANQHLRKYLAKIFHVPTSQVNLLRGASSRSKQFSIENPGQLPDAIQPSNLKPHS
ncbi:MAG TPA: YggU family protein [Gammaproteobacteria bacterium]|nr:YggU family protein [Gammaproteobacteria bacterium]